MASDITDRKLAEAALAESRGKLEQQKRLYETVTEVTPDLIYVFELNYRFTYANQALLSMWGKTWDNAIGKRLIENGYEPWHAELHESEKTRLKTPNNLSAAKYHSRMPPWGDVFTIIFLHRYLTRKAR
jgi:two-component system sensor histidine kinase VicK